ncbi:nucleotide pyrophosphohydrolase [Vibrio phage 11895-B1]|uniref:nucleotide pyrophosphohydrolase n=1 Tax=Vibrio phage 11895-B1 TaxID=754075 RepID=UPI0002C139F6|nr:nucleotide pyrophosphohydrolase [Vibrio phage 11895-B1]AGH32258.1 hypothetical protein VPHG_00195 [Vibrio phage 11895-B1]
MYKLTYNDLLTFENTVVKWNKIFGNNPDDVSLIPTYRDLTSEEFEELVEGIETNNHEETLDAIADIIYTSFMWAVLQGKGIATSADEAYYVNMWENMSIGTSLELCLERMSEALGENDSFKFKTYFDMVLFKLSDNYDIVSAFNRVTESNFSKSCDQSVDDGKEIEYILDEGRYVGIYTEESNGRVIFKAEYDVKNDVKYPKGKIVKPSTYRSPEDLGGLECFIYKEEL